MAKRACVDCAFYYSDRGFECLHPRLRTWDKVYGYSAGRPFKLRERGLCGPSGNLWIAKPIKSWLAKFLSC